MSTLEKAYLKAMNKNKDENGEPIENTDSYNIETNVPNKKEAHQLVSSRSGISRMSEDELYTTDILDAKGLIYANMRDSKLLDKYRNLRTRLLVSSNKDNFVTLVTSVTSLGDHSLISANIAATFALDEAKTSTLIEANIQNPSLNQLFDKVEAKGLIDYLETESWEGNEVLCKTGIPRLRLVPSGFTRENSAEYFTSDRMIHFVKELIERYPDRYPIINAPSILDSADAQILIDLCDKVILVAPYGQCTDEEIMQAAMTIGEEKLAGVLLDNF